MNKSKAIIDFNELNEDIFESIMVDQINPKKKIKINITDLNTTHKIISKIIIYLKKVSLLNKIERESEFSKIISKTI